MSYQLVHQLQKEAIPVKQTCRVLSVSRSGYYEAQRRSAKPVLCKASVHLKAAFMASHQSYGSRRLVTAMQNQGIQIGRHKVRSLMRKAALRTCSKFFKQKSQECQVNELQAGIEFTLAVFPQPPILLQPGKAALNNPAFGHDLEGMQLTPLGNLHCDGLSQNFSHLFSKRFSGVAAVAQQTLHVFQVRFAARQRLQCAFAVGYLRCCHCDGMRQALRIDRDMAFDA